VIKFVLLYHISCIAILFLVVCLKIFSDFLVIVKVCSDYEVVPEIV
jgi:hypothetical protein